MKLMKKVEETTCAYDEKKSGCVLVTQILVTWEDVQLSTQQRTTTNDFCFY